MRKKITVALAGNPNSGKTTIFNNLTGSHQHVGNYPGVTVEKKTGRCKYKDFDIEVVDLPGTYSLTAYSIEELTARNFIIESKPDVVVSIIDASNLERNLYLTTQLIELKVPLVLAFNMIDVALARGLKFDLEQLSILLGAPIIPTVGHKNQGSQELLEAITQIAVKEDVESQVLVRYRKDTENEIEKLVKVIEKEWHNSGNYSRRWLAIKLLENDREVANMVDSPVVHEVVEKSKNYLESLIGDPPEIIIAERRYGFIAGAVQETVQSTIESRKSASDNIDQILTNRLFAFPIFFGLMYLVFYITFTFSELPMGWIETFFGWLSKIISGFWIEGSDSVLRSLLVDGIIGGVGGVLVFLPNILFLFLAIAVLEDTGYMARAAFIMDRLMHKIGLHGKSFIPMLIGFGCSVPAIMATRTLDNQKDRMVTMMVVPLMSCGARLPIYALIIPAFFPQSMHAPIMWLIYLIGIVLAIISAKVLRITVFKGPSPPFVMELPPYRMPTLKATLLHMGERTWLYVRKAGTIILGISIILWALTSYPKLNDASSFNSPEEARTAELSHSFAGRIGQIMSPVLKPMGFDWKIGTALLGAIAAKEVFVAQLGIVYSVGEANEHSETLRQRLRDKYNPLTGFCIMLFALIATPCMATVATVKREANSWKWALFQFGGLTIMAFIITSIVYQTGSFLGIGV